MRRWEKEVLKTIRAEASNSLQTPGSSIGGHEHANEMTAGGGRGPELARVLHELSVEHGVDGQRHSLDSGTSTENNMPGKGDEQWAGSLLSKAVHEGEAVTSAQRDSATCGREADNNGEQLLHSGAAAVASGDSATEEGQRTPRQHCFPPEPYEGDVMRWGEGGEEESMHADLAGTGVSGRDSTTRESGDSKEVRQPERDEQGGDDAVKSIVEKLLRTSSSVAFAAARPLSIRPPPVLEVPEDAHQVR